MFVHVCAYARILLLADIPVPPELLAECKVVKEGSDGWMWDPFLASLHHEYLDCAGSDGQVLEAIPIAQQVVVEGQVLISAMHFITEYYLDLHKHTLECMQESLESLPIDSIDQWPTLTSDDETEVWFVTLPACRVK